MTICREKLVPPGCARRRDRAPFEARPAEAARRGRCDFPAAAAAPRSNSRLDCFPPAILRPLSSIEVGHLRGLIAARLRHLAQLEVPLAFERGEVDARDAGHRDEIERDVADHLDL